MSEKDKISALEERLKIVEGKVEHLADVNIALMLGVLKILKQQRGEADPRDYGVDMDLLRRRGRECTD